MMSDRYWLLTVRWTRPDMDEWGFAYETWKGDLSDWVIKSKNNEDNEVEYLVNSEEINEDQYNELEEII